MNREERDELRARVGRARRDRQATFSWRTSMHANERLRRWLSLHCFQDFDALLDALDASEAENERLRQTVDFYADINDELLAAEAEVVRLRTQRDEAVALLAGWAYDGMPNGEMMRRALAFLGSVDATSEASALPVGPEE